MSSPLYDSLPPAYRNNQAAWDRMAQQRHPLTQPATSQELNDPLSIVDGVGWLEGGISGKRLLCLAAGGGRHSMLYAAAGADVTVVDLSPEMLRRDKEASLERQLSVRLFEASMDSMPMLSDGEFDIVVHPVSTCYVPDILPVYREVARVLRGDGIYVSQHKQPANLQASLTSEQGMYRIEHAYYDRSPVPAANEPSRLREPGTMEYVHRWEHLIGGMCRAGFVIEDLIEPNHARAQEPPGSFGHRCHWISPYVRIKARRIRTASKLLRV